ncbi:hypothetical protein PGB90_005528 [Kerria lacca]
MLALSGFLYASFFSVWIAASVSVHIRSRCGGLCSTELMASRMPCNSHEIILKYDGRGNLIV